MCLAVVTQQQVDLRPRAIDLAVTHRDVVNMLDPRGGSAAAAAAPSSGDIAMIVGLSAGRSLLLAPPACPPADAGCRWRT